MARMVASSDEKTKSEDGKPQTEEKMDEPNIHEIIQDIQARFWKELKENEPTERPEPQASMCTASPEASSSPTVGRTEEQEAADRLAAEREWEAMKCGSPEYRELLRDRMKASGVSPKPHKAEEAEGEAWQQRGSVCEWRYEEQRCHVCSWIGIPSALQVCPDCGARGALSLRRADDECESGLHPCEVWIPDGSLLTAGNDEPEFIKVEVCLDSGAGLHVANPDHLPGYVVEPNDLSRAGAGFVAADGGTMANQGEVELNLTTVDAHGNEHLVKSKFHIANVTRALWSVGVICDAGLLVDFTAKDATVRKPDGTPICHFIRKKGLYVTTTKVRNPLYKGFQRQ